MISFTTYKISGEITSTGSCPDNTLAAQLVGLRDFGIIPYPSDIHTQYVSNGLVVTKPPQLSKHLTFNFSTALWEDLRSLAEHKSVKWAEFKKLRSQEEYAGFLWDGSVFDSDAISQQHITRAVTQALMDGPFPINWTLANNTVRSLSNLQMKQLGGALGLHVEAKFSHAQGLRAQLDAATTIEEVVAIVW